MKPDERWAHFSIGLHRLFLPRLEVLRSYLGPEWAPYQGLRSFDEQEALYKEGRTLPGRVVTWAHGWESAHNYGCAVDLTIFVQGKPIWELPPSEWSALGQACERANLEWGGSWPNRKDKPHVQLPLRCTWKEVCLHKAKGYDVEKFIVGNLRS